jgi:antitoxin FitA
MSMTIQLDDEQSQRLADIARDLQVSTAELAKAVINDLISRQAADFERAARHVLEKNRELYRRLS